VGGQPTGSRGGKAGSMPYQDGEEKVVLDLRPHWSLLIPPLLVGALAILGASLLYGLIPGSPVQQPLRLAVLGLGLGVLALWVLPRLVRWATTRFVLTSERLIYRRGLLARHAREIPIERLNDVTVSQSLWERLMGYGDVLVQAVGEPGRLPVHDLPHPRRVQDAISRAAASGPSEPAAVGPGAGASVVEQLHHLVDLRDRGVISREEFQRIKEDLIRRL
jgi:membrane protein YdbS with pleckstrin-like domain